MRRFVSRGLAVATAFVLVGCGGGDGPTGGDGGGNGGGAGAATSISPVSGDTQRGVPGSSLLAPFVVKVGDAAGNGISGITVTWSVTAGGGSLSQTSTVTNSVGEATVVLTLGSPAGQNTVTASAAELTGSPVTFTASAVEPTSIVSVSGAGQSARLAQPLSQPLVVEVRAGDGLGVPGVTVSWAVTVGGGTVSATSTTGATGRASADFTLGPSTGANSVTASVSGLMGSPVSFDATATLPVRVTVEMLGIAFVAPGGGDNITIMLGDTVEWVNRDAVQHDATSNSQPSGGSSFASPLLSLGQTFRFVPNVRGAWVYFCTVHPVQMRDARITVN